MSLDPSQFGVWTPPRRSRGVELGRLPVRSGQLAVRDVYDLDRPQAVLEVPAGDHRVWVTEVDVHGPGDRTVLLQPAYLSVQLSDGAPTRVGSPDTLHRNAILPYGVSVYTDLGILLLHDADAITAADMESLDADFEQAWESSREYSEVRSRAGAVAITCKTVADRSRFPILASFDAEDRPVAVHIDFGVVGTSRSR